MAQTLKFGNGVWANKDNSTLAYNDENGNYKPLPFNFTRSTSATRINKQGFIEVVRNNKPRIDYKDSAKGALILEPSRTNLLPYSESLNQWTLTNVTLTQNALISPDGTLNASRIVTTSTDVDVKFSSITVSANTVYTFSFYCYYVNGEPLIGRLYDNSNGANIEYFDYTQQIEQGNWVRVQRTFTTPTGCTNIQAFALAATGVAGADMYFWGMQLEQGSYATSYIPTQGAVVTRVTEIAKNAGNYRYGVDSNEIFNNSEGVLYADIAALANDNTSRKITLNNGNYTNQVSISFGALSNLIESIVYDGVAVQAYLTYSSAIIKDFNKIALKYKNNDFALWVNGFKVNSTLTGVTTSLDLFALSFNTGFSGGDDFYGKTKELGYYDTVLTDTELEYLTSYRSWESMVNELNLNIIYNG